MERHAELPGPTQRRHAMTDLLERRSEAVSEQLDVVTQRLGRFEERRVRHQHRAREIVRERDTREATGFVAGEDVVAHDALEEVLADEQTNLIRELEVA